MNRSADHLSQDLKLTVGIYSVNLLVDPYTWDVVLPLFRFRSRYRYGVYRGTYLSNLVACQCTFGDKVCRPHKR